jgi:transposase
VRLLPPQYVRPYVRRNKTDRTDAEALLEAVRCGDIRPVPVKTREQQTLQALHRVRRHWQGDRTARINAMRGLLREHGLPIGVGVRTAMARIPALLEDATVPLPDLVRHLVWLMLEEVRALDARLATVDQQLARVAREHLYSAITTFIAFLAIKRPDDGLFLDATSIAEPAVTSSAGRVLSCKRTPLAADRLDH